MKKKIRVARRTSLQVAAAQLYAIFNAGMDDPISPRLHRRIGSCFLKLDKIIYRDMMRAFPRDKK